MRFAAIPVGAARAILTPEMRHIFESFSITPIINRNGKQPNAAIFIQAHLHVSKKRSDSDKYINNKNIDRLNSELSKSANGKSTFYIDVNPLFDDKDGNLSLDKTSDNAHLYAKYYTEWGEWICKETAKVLKERQS